MSGKGLHLHFFCKLAVLLATIVIASISPAQGRSIYLMVVLTVFALLQGQLKNSIMFWCFFGAIVGLLFMYQCFSWSDDIVSRYTFILTRNTLPVFFALYIFGSTPVSEITSGFDSLRFPKRTGIAVVTLFRYVPTLAHDLGMAVENLKLRGLGGFRNLATHPGRTLKCFTLPLIVHAHSTADELAVSATARGAESLKKRYSLYGKSFCPLDGALLSVMLVALSVTLFL